MDDKIIKKLMAEVEKDLELGICFGSNERFMPDAIPFGIPQIDDMLGGGIPKSRYTLIEGWEGAGKTTLIQKLIANCQKLGGTAMYIDAEGKYNQDWFKLTGVDVDKMIFISDNIAEQVWQAMIKFMNAGIDLIIIDSVAALLPSDQYFNAFEKNYIALLPRFLSASMPILAADLRHTHTALVFINQLRESPAMGGGGGGVYAPGGKAIKFYASVRIRMNRGTVLHKGQEAIGIKIKMKSEKNVMAPPYRKTEVVLRFDGTIDIIIPLIEQAIGLGVIIKEKSSYYWKDKKFFGLNKTVDYFTNSVKAVDNLKKKIKKAKEEN